MICLGAEVTENDRSYDGGEDSVAGERGLPEKWIEDLAEEGEPVVYLVAVCFREAGRGRRMVWGIKRTCAASRPVHVQRNRHRLRGAVGGKKHRP